MKPPAELPKGSDLPAAADERRSALRRTLSEAKQRFQEAQGRGRHSRPRHGGEPFSAFDSVPDGLPPPPRTKRDFKADKKDAEEQLAIEDTRDTTTRSSKKRKLGEDDKLPGKGVLKQLVEEGSGQEEISFVIVDGYGTQVDSDAGQRPWRQNPGQESRQKEKARR